MADIKIGLGVSDNGVATKLNEIEKNVKAIMQAMKQVNVKPVADDMKKVEKATKETASAMDELKKAAGITIAGMGLQQLASKIIDVRKEFQSLEVSFSTLLGSDVKGKAMFKSITDFATKTPLLEKDLASAAQTMLGFNIESERVMPLLRQIGDISMGDSQKLQSLVLAFSQASSTGKLMGQDLLQMINAGFNPLAEISRTTGKSIGELKDEMSAGKITIDMIEGAFASATSEGGKYNDMLLKMSETMGGSLSNLEGAIQKLFNDIGVEMEGSIVSGVNGATEAVNYLAENLENVGKVIAECIVVFGAYKTACVIATTATKGYTVASMAEYKWLLLVEKAQKLLNATMLANPYIAVTTAVVALGAALYHVLTTESSAVEAQKALNKELEETKEKEEKLRQELEKDIKTCNDDSEATDERNKALQRLVGRYPSIIKKYIDERGHLKDIIKLKKEIAEIDGKKSVNDTRKNSEQYAQYAKIMRKHEKGQTLADEEKEMIEKARKEYGSKTGHEGATIWKMREFFEAGSKQYGTQADKQETQLAINKFTDSLSKKNKADLKRWEDVFRKASKNKGVTTISGFGTLNGDQIASLLLQVQEANKPKQSYSDAYAKAQKAWNDAKKKVESAKKGTAEEYQKAVESLNAAEKEFKKYGGKVDKAGKSENEEANRREKRLVEERKFADQEKAYVIASQNFIEQAKIDSMKDGAEKERRQRELDHQMALQQIEKEAEEMKKATYEHNKAIWEADNKDKKRKYEDTTAGKAGWQGLSLSSDQQNIINAKTSSENAKYKRANAEALSADRQYMIDYLSQYGDMQQKKMAIEMEYAEKIAKAKNDFEKASLEKQMKERVDALKSENAFDAIDWETVFTNLESHTTDYLQGLRKQLQDLLASGTVTSIQDIEKIQQKINEITEQVDKKGGIFNFTGSRASEHNRLVNAASDARANADSANAEWQKAMIDYLSITAKAAVNPQDIALANKAQIAEAKLAEAREKAAKATQKAESAEDAANRTKMQQIKDGASDFAEAMQPIVDNINGLNDLTKAIGLGNTEFGKGVQNFTEGANHGMSAAQNLASGNFFGAAAESVQMFQSFGRMLGIGGGNEAEVNKITEKNTEKMAYLSERIDALKDSVDKNTGVNAVNASKAAEEAQKETNKLAMQTLQAQMGYHSAHHSNEYYASDQKIAELYKNEINSAIASGQDMQKSIDGLNDIYNMTPEQIAAIKTYMPNLWEYLTTVGKYDKSEYWEAVVDQAGKLEAISAQLKENLTTMSFESMRSDFISQLSDMNTSASDFANNFSKMMFNAVLNAQIDAALKDQLQAYYDKFASYMGNDAIIDTKELEELQRDYNAIYQKGMEIRNAVAQATGYATSAASEATSKGVKSITEETANQLVGRITAMQIAVNAESASVSSIAERIGVVATNTQSILSVETANNAVLQDLRMGIAMSNSFLEDIAKYNKTMVNEWSGKIEDIRKVLKDKL